MPVKKKTKRKRAVKTTKRKTVSKKQVKRKSVSKKKVSKPVKRLVKLRSKTVPTGVRVISILGYILSAFILVLALLLFTGAALIAPYFSLFNPFLGPFSPATVGITLGMLFLIIAGVYFLVSKALMSGRRWARILVIIIVALGVLGGIMSLFKGAFFDSVLRIAVNGVIGWYLIDNDEVRSYFNN